MPKCIAGLLPLLLAGLSLAADAQTWPSRPIRIIVATSPPGGADTVARMLAPGLSERLGQQVVVENRAGASTMIGHEVAAKAAPDGYTLVMGISTLAINPATFRKVPYDALRDFAPITQAVKQALLLVVHPSFPAKSVKALVAIAKQQPGAVNYSSPGFGTNPQMGMELFLYMTGTRLYHVPYRGGGESIISVVSGHVPVTVASMLGTVPQVRVGRVRALGVTTAVGVSRDIIARVNKETVSILRAPEVTERLAADGSFVVAGTPEEFGVFMRAETEKWAKVAKAAGIKPE